MKKIRSSLNKHLSAVSLSAVIFTLYLFTLAPGITWSNWGADGGDYLSALFTWGIPHPPGYPTYLALARIFSLLPIGSFAFRGNLFSAACMTVSAVILYLMMKKLLPSNPLRNATAFLSALFFALAPLVWSQAVITEVYGLHALFMTVLLFLILTANPRSKGDFFWIGLLLGIGLGNHLTLAALTPLFLLLEPKTANQRQAIHRLPGNILLSNPVWPDHPAIRDSNIFIRAKLFVNRYMLLPKVIGMILGVGISYSSLLVYAYSDSPVRWLNPVTLERFWELVSAKMYHFYWGFPSVGRLQDALNIIFSQTGWLGFFLAVVGIVHLYERRYRRILIVSGYVFLVAFLFTLDYQTEDSEVYLIPAVLSMAIWIGYGIRVSGKWMLEQWHKDSLQLGRRALILAVLVPCFSLLVTQVAFAYAQADASRDARALNYAEGVMHQAPESALIFTKDDKETFSLWYFQFVEGKRPDIAIIVIPFLFHDWYRELLSQTYPDLMLPILSTQANRQTLEALNTRPSCSTSSLANVVLVCN